MINLEILPSLAQFGVAGLMGALWIWERHLSRQRERQLSEAHRRLMAERQELRTLVRLVRQNTQAMERFEQTQQRLSRVLEHMQSHVHLKRKESA